jgi:hypothetical protein
MKAVISLMFTFFITEAPGILSNYYGYYVKYSEVVTNNWRCVHGTVNYLLNFVENLTLQEWVDRITDQHTIAFSIFDMCRYVAYVVIYERYARDGFNAQQNPILPPPHEYQHCFCIISACYYYQLFVLHAVNITFNRPLFTILRLIFSFYYTNMSCPTVSVSSAIALILTLVCKLAI